MFAQPLRSQRLATAILFGGLFSGAAIAQDSTYQDAATFESDSLTETNNYRVLHQSVAATWNDSMASAAATYASGCVFEHPSLYEQGSNLAAGFDNPTDVVTAWYDEVNDPGYDFSNPGPQDGTLHFTQLVWNASTQIGCGAYYCGGTNSVPGWYMVCYYYPEGNVVLYGDEGYYFERNVFPATTSTSTTTTASSTTSASVSTTTSGSSTITSTTSGSTTAVVPSSNPIANATVSTIYSNSSIVGVTTILGATSQTVIHPTAATTISLDGLVIAVDPVNTAYTILDGVVTGAAAESALASALGQVNVAIPTASSGFIDPAITATSTEGGIIAGDATTTVAAPWCTQSVQYVMLGEGIMTLLVPASNISARAFHA